jgi:hypothetical protein
MNKLINIIKLKFRMLRMSARTICTGFFRICKYAGRKKYSILDTFELINSIKSTKLVNKCKLRVSGFDIKCK